MARCSVEARERLNHLPGKYSRGCFYRTPPPTSGTGLRRKRRGRNERTKTPDGTPAKRAPENFPPNAAVAAAVRRSPGVPREWPGKYLSRDTRRGANNIFKRFFQHYDDPLSSFLFVCVSVCVHSFERGRDDAQRNET